VGFRVQLIAVTGKEPRVVQRDFGVTATGQREEIAESPVVGTTLPNGAYLLYINEPDRILPGDKVFARLSKGASLIACYANETMMNSSACGWTDGVERWAVSHDAQQDVEHLETSGILPPELQPISERLFAQQKGDHDVDYIFDIPIELFAAIGGIRYDYAIPGGGPDPWEILESRAGPA
jgi:hypothetical protein